MQKIIKLARKMRIEEIFLASLTILFILIYFILFSKDTSWIESFKQELSNLALGLRYFTFSVFFFVFIAAFKLYLWGIKKVFNRIEKKHNTPETERKKINIGIIRSAFPIIRLHLLIGLFFSALIGILGSLSITQKDRLVNELFMKIDYELFGQYPFIWLQSSGNIFRNLDVPILLSFAIIALFMSATLVMFYMAKNRKLLSQYIMALSFAVLLSMPLWYIFPSNSPQNAFINNVHNKEIEKNISKSLENYKPTPLVANFQKGIDEYQRENPPISTMPSMHAAWAFIITYLVGRYRKKLLFIFLPWAIFSTIGTVFLAQHYLIDIVVSIPIAILSVQLSGFLCRLEDTYYANAIQDTRENELKEGIKKDLNKIIIIVKSIFSIVINRDLSKKGETLIDDFMR